MSPIITSKPLDILLVEDNPTDVLLIQEALKEDRLFNYLHLVEDGVEALDFLRQQGQYATAPRPDLILLDLNLPKKNGHEVLTEIKTNPDLKTIPVIILTTSRAEEDIVKAYGLQANSYVVKPIDFAGFTEVVRSIGQFWSGVATLPGDG
jgi:CheY-like chemotaxis protein